MKKIILLSCIIFGSLKADTIFFDLHDVVLKKRTFEGKTIKKLKIEEQKKWFLDTVSPELRTIVAEQMQTIIKSPSTYTKVALLLWKKEKIVENFVNFLCTASYTPNVLLGSRVTNRYYEEFRKAFLHFMNAIYEEDPEMIKLLQDLKEEGHTLCILSNIGAEIFEDARTNNLFPHLFDGSLFAFPHNSINNKIPESNPADGSFGYYTEWKPMKAAYDKALIHTQSKAADSWMVDDKLKNSPEKFGWKGFFTFTTAAQLRKDLEKSGLLKTRQSL